MIFFVQDRRIDRLPEPHIQHDLLPDRVGVVVVEHKGDRRIVIDHVQIDAISIFLVFLYRPTSVWRKDLATKLISPVMIVDGMFSGVATTLASMRPT